MPRLDDDGLPETLVEFETMRDAAIAKYQPLVKALSPMEFLGLLSAVKDEADRRNVAFKAKHAPPSPGSRIGR